MRGRCRAVPADLRRKLKIQIATDHAVVTLITVNCNSRIYDLLVSKTWIQSVSDLVS
jgi:hypothetical protein